jgi:hypothetical protein
MTAHVGRSIGRRGWTAVGVAVVMPVSAVAVAAPATAAAAAPRTPEAVAQQRAAEIGERVEVPESRTDASQVFAEPDGQLVYESSAVPKFVRKPDGSWRDVKLKLEPGPDGTVRSVSSAADVRFSDGGSEPFATVVRDAKVITNDHGQQADGGFGRRAIQVDQRIRTPDGMASFLRRR